MICMGCGGVAEQAFDEVGMSDASQALFDVSALLGFIPEEVLPLCKLFAGSLCAVYGLQRIGIIARIPGFGGHRHRGGGEVLHLFKLEVELLGDYGEFSHVYFVATGVTGNEIGDNLLAEMCFLVDAVEHVLELVKLLKRWFAHQTKHLLACVLGCNLQTAADMSEDEFTGVLACRNVCRFVLASVEYQVVAYTASDEAFLNARQCVNGMVYV